MDISLPPGATNAHCHVFGPRERFPYAVNGTFAPEQDAPKEALFALNDSLGLQRCVVVQSSCHGFDNRAMEDALIARPDTYRGIALLPTTTSFKEIERLHALGVRGVRFHYMAHLGQATPIEEVLAFATRFADLGWHLQIHGSPNLLTDLASALRLSPVPVVIDHIGRIDASLGMQHADFQALVSLMRSPHCWVKVSGMDRITKLGPPYLDAQPLAKFLVDEFGDRVVWGNDWPHPNHAGPAPNERQLVELIAAIAPERESLQRLLVANPERLYDFSSLAIASTI
jgi:2-pyrone-4,6-dicarboxylate lactonase